MSDHSTFVKSADHLPMTLTISGNLAAEIRQAAENHGWTTAQAVQHVVADLARVASSVGICEVENAWYGPASPEEDETFVTLDNA